MKSWMNRWRWAVAAAGLSALATTGCSSGSEIPEPPSVQQKAALLAFSGQNACTDLEQYIEDTAVLQMRTQLEAQRDGVPSWGWWGGWGWGPEFDAANGGPQASAGGAAPPRAAPTDYTTTNNQVAGVDEADFVKNDGTRIFVLSGERLHAVKSWPADQTQVLGTLKIEGWPQEMFLDGADKAVVFSSIYQWYPLSNTMGVACDAMYCGYYYANTVKVTVVDVSDMANMHVLSESYLPGQYNSARKVGSSVRLVLSDNFNFPAGFKWSPDWVPGLWEDKQKLHDAYDQIIADNEKLIRAQTLAEWVPAAKVKTNGTTLVVPHQCSKFSRVNAPTRLGTVSVVTVNLQNNNIDRTSVLAEPGEIYASTNNLYVATRHWWWWPAPGQKDTTYVHKFDISSPNEALYVASGTVDGHIVDQFSMDESAGGQFRVVTTINQRVPDLQNPTNWWGTMETWNRLTVLNEHNGFLDVGAQSEDLAKGERVMSSRIIGDKAFVVTYRQVDPLFTFDLSDPTKVVKKGELKIPGFSTYMHPLDANHLLTIGTYIPEPVNGQPQDWSLRALQLAIFDVSDLSNPVQTHVQLVGTASGWSEAQYEHKAFNYFPARKLLAIPFADWNSSYSGNDYWSYFTSDLRVFEVDPVTGFTPKGAVGMRDLYQVQQYYNWTYYWTPHVRRSVMADEFVYAISDAGIRVANIANLSAPLATASLTRYVEYP